MVEQCFADLTYLITITVRIQMACRRRERMKQTADMMMDPGLHSSHASSGLVLAARRLLLLDLNQRILSTPDFKEVKHNGEQTSAVQCNNWASRAMEDLLLSAIMKWHDNFQCWPLAKHLV